MPPEALAADLLVTAFLTTIERRVRLLDLVRATAIGILAATVLFVPLRLVGVSRPSALLIAVVAGLVILLATAWLRHSRRDPSSAATLVERALPASRNVVFTARELLASPGAAAPWVRRRVVDGAARILAEADPSAVVPLGKDVIRLVVAAGVAAVVIVLAPAGLARLANAVGAPSNSSAVPPGSATLRVLVTVLPPAYTGLGARRVTDPAALEVVAGSRITLEMEGGGAWSVRFGTRVLIAASAGERRTEIVPTDSGYFAIERPAASEARLIPVTVTPDRAPTVRFEAPARDLLLPAAQGQVALAVVAADDFGLADVSLAYTKVSGSGEQFEFTEGALPLTVTRESGHAWQASGAFDLPRLGLEPGDAIVYHAVAKDARPGGLGSSTSDTFFVEIAGPGQVALPGFELPPDRERYALSQQMILLKLKRLRARESTLSREALTQEVESLGAEQRSVRANFIFLMGGSVEDEEEEAAQSNEIQEGRLENSARREISRAIHFMSEVQTALGAVNTGAALPPAKSAVEALQRAFGRNRYFLKTLAERSRIDPSRRLTGDLKEASDWRRVLIAATDDPKSRDARLLLTRLLDLATAEGALPAASAAPAVARLAEEALAIAPGSPDWQKISSSLARFHDALVKPGAPDATRTAFRDSVTPLLAIVRKGAVRGTNPDPSGDRLRGAWAAQGTSR
ncbi:MAG: hypothetical protein ABIX28_18235 [Vicinamibacterales bacterium]